MKKYFFISNRQSGKTHYAIYEFIKDPEKAFLIVCDQKMKNHVIELDVIPEKYTSQIITPKELNKAIKNKNIERIIYDEYLYLEVWDRSEIINNISNLKLNEIFCFSTPRKLYDQEIFEFVKGVKRENRFLILEEFLNKKELLIELNDLRIKSKNQLTNEIWDLYYNHITDPETVIIHNKFFYNQKIFNLDNVSYFPDLERELAELKGEFIKQA